MAIQQLAWPVANINSQTDFTPLAKLGDIYREARNRDQLADLGKKLADGSITYKQAAGEAANMGNMDATLKFLALQNQQDELGATNSAVARAGAILGGGPPGAAPASSAATTIAPPPSVGPQAAAPNLAVNPAASAPAAPAAPPLPAAPTATPQGAVGYPRNENEARDNIAKLNNVLNTRNLPKSSSDTLSRLLEAQYKYLEEKDPAEVRTLRALANDPTLMAAEIARRKASKPETNVITQAETAEAKAQGEATVDNFKTIAKEGPAARQQLANLNQLGDLSTQFKTGGPAALQGALANWGIKVGKNVGPVEAYSAVIDKMTPGERIPGSGSSSDFDAKMFKRGLPQLINSPEGNTILRGTYTAMAQDKLAHAEIAQRYLTRQITAKQAMEEAKALPDPFARYKEWKAQQDAKPQGFEGRFDASRPTGVAPGELEAEMRRRGIIQ